MQPQALKRRRRMSRRILLLVLLNAAISGAWAAPVWQSTLTDDPPGNFPPLRPVRANYRFGWAGMTAAAAEVRFNRTAEGHCQIQGAGRTIGLARALWKFDVSYRAVANAETLRPIDATETETVRSKKVTTHLVFSGAGVSRSRTEGPGAGTTKTKEFAFSNIYDLQSAMLYLRSQPLKDRSIYRVLVYPATNAYLAIITVVGREKVPVRAASYNAIKMDLQLNRVGKNSELEAHRKFRRASIWVSDDSDRLILRIEAQIFIGTVFAELQSVRFDNPRP